MSVEQLYQEIILEHYRAKHHSGLREPYDTEVHHVNPSCGDELTLRVVLDGDQVSDVSYEGVGCSISPAATSVMSERVVGAPVSQALQLHDGFQQMIQGKGELSLDEDVYGDAVAFEGVARFPARVKCAMLGWAALRDALLRAHVAKEDR